MSSDVRWFANDPFCTTIRIMKFKLDNSFIIDANRHCYDMLGANYTDGAADFELLKQNGIWGAFLDSISGGGAHIKRWLRCW